MPVTALALAGLITCAPGYDRAAYERVATLWPKASIRTMKVGGKAQKVIAPITRKGESGFIDRVERHSVGELGTIYAFSIQVASPPVDVNAWLAGEQTPKQVRHLAQAIFIRRSDGKVSKPDGFPLERVVDTTCIGDVCAHEALYQGLMPVLTDRQVVVLLTSPKGFEDRVGYALEIDPEGLQRMFEVKGPRTLAGEIGCDASERWEALKWDRKKQQLVATVQSRCDCNDDCREHGFPPGNTTEQRPLKPLKR